MSIFFVDCATFFLQPLLSECLFLCELLNDQACVVSFFASSLRSVKIRSKANKAQGQAKRSPSRTLPGPVTLQCTVILPGTFPLWSTPSPTPPLPPKSSQIHDNKTTNYTSRTSLVHCNFVDAAIPSCTILITPPACGLKRGLELAIRLRVGHPYSI